MDLRSARLTVCETLEAAGHVPRFQERFDHGYRSLHEFLRDQVAQCQAVVCLAGPAFGAAPEPTGGSHRSYTQIEYDVARQLGLPVFVFMASGHFPLDSRPDESGALVELQRAHLDALRRSHKWTEFQSLDRLRDSVEDLARQLPRVLPLRLQDHQRPAPPPYFVGRVEELAQLSAAVRSSSPSMIVVVGMGGQGKSTLVDRWLREQPRLDWTTGMWISLDRGEIDFDRFLDWALGMLLGDAYDKRDMPGLELRSAELIRLLQAKPTLLVLDGIERWLRGWAAEPNEGTETVDMRSASSRLIDDFLLQAAVLTNGSHVVLTARALPAILDDVACNVIPVRDEGRIESILEGLDATAAVELLRRLGVQGTTDELAKASEAYHAHPLALTILAGLLRKRYGGQLEKLPEVSPLDPRRSLYSLLESTLRNLPSPQRAERFLVVAAQALEDPPLRALGGSLPGEGDALRDLAVTLADWSVIRWDGAREVVHLHPLVRQFAAARANEDDVRAIHSAYSGWYESLSLPASPTTLEQLAPRLLAIEHALLSDDTERCADLIFAVADGERHLVGWAQALGHHSAVSDLLGRVAAASPRNDRPSLLIPRAALLRRLGHLEEALADLDRALDILSPEPAEAQMEREAWLIGARINRGNVLRQLSRPVEALHDYDEALELLGNLPRNDPLRATQFPSALMNRGLALRELGRFTEAADECGQVVYACRGAVAAGRRDLLPLLSHGLTNRGILLTELGRADHALPLFDEALEIQLGLGPSGVDVHASAQVRISKAAALLELDAPELAIHNLDDVIDELGPLVEGGRNDLLPLVALATLGRAQASLKSGSLAEALEQGRRAIRLHEDLVESGRGDLRSWLALALLNQAEARYRIGDPVEAGDQLSRGLTILEARISTGEPETRVLYLRKAAEAARYLADDVQKGRMVLERAVDQFEAGLEAEEAVEALRLEAGRAVRVISELESEVFGPLSARLAAHAL